VTYAVYKNKKKRKTITFCLFKSFNTLTATDELSRQLICCDVRHSSVSSCNVMFTGRISRVNCRYCIYSTKAKLKAATARDVVIYVCISMATADDVERTQKQPLVFHSAWFIVQVGYTYNFHVIITTTNYRCTSLQSRNSVIRICNYLLQTSYILM